MCMKFQVISNTVPFSIEGNHPTAFAKLVEAIATLGEKGTHTQAQQGTFFLCGPSSNLALILDMKSSSRFPWILLTWMARWISCVPQWGFHCVWLDRMVNLIQICVSRNGNINPAAAFVGRAAEAEENVPSSWDNLSIRMLFMKWLQDGSKAPANNWVAERMCNSRIAKMRSVSLGGCHGCAGTHKGPIQSGVVVMFSHWSKRLATSRKSELCMVHRTFLSNTN